MATFGSRMISLFRRSTTPAFSHYLQQYGKEYGRISEKVSTWNRVSFCTHSYASGRTDREHSYSGFQSRPRRHITEEFDEYSEHHLAESTRSKLEQLSRRHRQEAVSDDGSDGDGLKKSFSDFPLEPSLVETLERLGYKSPFAIQIRTLEHTLNSRDVIGQAVTGSGKTLAFAVPIVNKLYRSIVDGSQRNRNPRAVVLTPTRELCNQIYSCIQELDFKVRCIALYGGASYERQERDLARGVDVICATPGRLNDHLDRGNINLSNLEFLCLDEADEMLTPNFREQIHNIFEDSPSEKQVMMFSATMPPEVREVASRYLKDPVYIDIISDKLQAPVNIEHQCIKAPAVHHVAIATHLLHELNAQRCILFVNTKVKTNHMAQALRRHGIKAQALNSDLSQNRREAILSAFRTGDLRVLCATDVAARGLDIPETDLIIQVGPPDKGLEFYIHRSGRTGRAGRKGLAVMLHSGFSSEMDIIRQISRSIPLKHVAPPERIHEQLRDQKLKKALGDIARVSQNDINSFLPSAKKLMESQQDSASTVAAALAVLCQADVEEDMPRSIPSRVRGDRDDFGNVARPRSSTFQRRNNLNRLSLWDEDSDDSFHSQKQRYR